MSTYGIEINGFRSLNKELGKLEGREARKKIRKALKKSARLIIVKARSNLPSQYSTLKKSMVSQFRKPRSSNYQTIKIAFTVGYSARYNGWYAHIIERGADAHEILPKTRKAMNAGDDNIVKNVKHPGVRARPFFRPAFDTKYKAMITTFGQTLFAEIKKDIKA